MRSASGRRRHRTAVSVEPLEGRRLLSFYTGPSTIRPVMTPGGAYQISVTGGGLEKVHQLAPGVFELDLFGTTTASTVTVSLLRARPHMQQTPLQLGLVNVKSGQLGSIQALDAADLVGTITPIQGSVSSLAFNEFGPNARVDIAGSLGGLTAGSVDLGPNGHIDVAGDLSGSMTVDGPLLLDGGQISIGNDVTVPASTATGTGTTGTSNVAISAGNLTIQQSGLFRVGRDLNGVVDVNGDLTLNSGGNFAVGRELQDLMVNGNVVVQPTGGAIAVGGDLNNLLVNGFFRGKGTDQPDLLVGLNLNNLTVQGGSPGMGGVQSARIIVGKNLANLSVAHGIFNSFISAGVAIGGSGTSAIGPDATDAIVNSDIRAGVSIANLQINGNVRSDRVTNPSPTGYPTRIVAGEDADGNYLPNGTISNVTITGSLINSVLAASVAPYGGNGTLPATGYGAPPPAVGKPPGDLGFNTYDDPAGMTTTTSGGTTVALPNYTELSFINGVQVPGTFYNTTDDPTIDDAILPGSISATTIAGVISTPHNSFAAGDYADYTGVFAAHMSGVVINGVPVGTGATSTTTGGSTG